MELHPNKEHLLPLLDTGTRVVAESLDILQFLDSAFPPRILAQTELEGAADWLDKLSSGPSVFLLLPGWYNKADREYYRKYKELTLQEISEAEGGQP